MPIPNNKMASGRRTSGMIIRPIPLNSGVRFPNTNTTNTPGSPDRDCQFVAPDLEDVEAEIRKEREVLQKLAARNERELQGIINPSFCPAPVDAYKANQMFHENVFPKKWKPLMEPLQHLVSPEKCKICLQEFASVDEAKVHYYTKKHVKKHLEQIEKESACKAFLPPGWRTELSKESEIIED